MYMYFFTPIPWVTKEETPFIQSCCVGWHMPHAALGLLTRPVLRDVVNGSSLTFTAEELRLLLPYPRAVVSVCGEGQMWKHLVLLQCGKDLFFAGPARLQPMAQNELISDAAVFLPISLRGRYGDVHWAHRCFTHLVKNLLANLFSLGCVFLQQMFRCFASSGHGGVGAAAPGWLTVYVGGTAGCGDVVRRAQQMTGPICLVQRLGLLQAGHAHSFSPLRPVSLGCQ